MMAERIQLLNATLAAAAANVAGTEFTGLAKAKYIALEAKFVRAAGGTTCKVWIQTSLDGGVSWFDVACFAFATTSLNKLHALRYDPATPLTPATQPASATLADDTVLNGVIGDRLRTLMTTTGDYSGASSIQIHAVIKD
jgi:hypothetical protein